MQSCWHHGLNTTYELGKDLMVLTNERYSEDHLGVVHELQRFVGVPETDIKDEILLAKHGSATGKNPKMDPTTRRFLDKFYHPYNLELIELLGQDWYDNNVGSRWDPK